MEFNSLEDVFQFFNRANIDVIKDLQRGGLLASILRCKSKNCRSICHLKRKLKNPLGHIFICSQCGKEYSVIKKSIFQKTKIEPKIFFYIIWHWCCLVPSNVAANILFFPRQSIYEEYRFLSKVCSWKISQQLELLKLGGEGKVVQIDSTVVSKKKDKDGVLVPDKWILGLYDAMDNKGVIVNISNKHYDTLYNVVKKYILPGTEVWTDSWSNSSLSGNDKVYIHRTFKSTKDFIDPHTGEYKNFAQEYFLAFMKFCRRLGVLQPQLVPGHVDRFLWTQCYGTSPSICCKNILAHVVEFYKK